MKRRLFVLLALAVVAPLAAQAQGTKSLTPADLQAWKTIRNPDLSSNGQWLAYVLAPNEGDANVVIRSTRDGGKEYTFSIGEPPRPTFGPPGAAGQGSAAVTISEDSKWAAFMVHPTQAESRRARTARRPTQTKVAIVNLATGEKREYDKIRRFVFAGDAPRYVALSGYPNVGQSPTSAAAAAGPGGAASPAASAASAPADLLLLELSTGVITNIGNVGEFGFDRMGHYLAYTIDARDRIGNGIQLRDLRTDVVRALDSEPALYRRLAWVDSGYGLAVLRGTVDTVAKDTLYTVLAFTGARAPERRMVFDAAGRPDFPAGMKVAGERAPRFASDLGTVFFGIKEARKPDAGGRQLAEDQQAAPDRSVVQTGAPGAGGTLNQPRVDPNDETPSLIIWHHRDPRLQSQQLVQEQADRNYTYLASFRFGENRFLRLADDTVRQLNILPFERFATGTDNQQYQQQASYNGRNFADVYVTDLRTGARKRVLEKHLNAQLTPSPDGTRALYWGHDGHWYVMDLASGASRGITPGAPVSFVNDESDLNNLHPPPRFLGNLGWAKDNQHVLLNDGWDIWRIPVARGGAGAVNLTGNGRSTQTRYSRVTTDLREKGVDLAKPVYFSTYGERTKKMGLARWDGRATTPLFTEDARFTFGKASGADVFILTRQTAVDFPDYYVTDASFRSRHRLTDANPQQKEFLWTPGVRLVDYTTDKGDKLQGALYLPGNYEPGKQYPLLVTIYEKRSQLAHMYVAPNETSTPNRSLYTSRGFAVFDPDIAYKVNDPGMSAVWAVIPAVKAAIATGVVDSTNIGLWGHSWGGYQTSFLVTQTGLFKAAIAGAPLTDLVSMYSSIYWNTGSTNQAIFESSQGRFTGNFIDNYDAYIRNSPAFHAKNVETPLVIMHNDKDGAVDFNQGITYYNTLRQLGKDVILLEYVGENHGLQRPANQKDYAQRMGEWFDHYLRGMPAPEWMVKGVPRLKMDEHLKQRREAANARRPAVP